MSAPQSPRRPAEVPANATVVELIDLYHRHLLPLAAARVGAGSPGAELVAGHALAALAAAAAVVSDLAGERPAIVRDALASGATPAEVAAATGQAPAPAPLEREPRAVRPPFEVRDDRWEHLHAVDPEGWRRAVHLDRVAALLEPLDGLELSDRERAALEWLAGWDIPTIAPLVRVLWAVRAAVPLPAGGAR